jgi:hypothetical protein
LFVFDTQHYLRAVLTTAHLLPGVVACLFAAVTKLRNKALELLTVRHLSLGCLRSLCCLLICACVCDVPNCPDCAVTSLRWRFSSLLRAL